MFPVSGFKVPDRVAEAPVKPKKKKNNLDLSPDDLQALLDQKPRKPRSPLTEKEKEKRESEPEPKKRKNVHKEKSKPGKSDHKKEKVLEAAEKKIKSENKTKKATEKLSQKPSQPPQNKPKLTPMQLKMQEKLSGSRFRWINEKLYTSPSNEAVQLFKDSPQVFTEYHTGFRHQVESWPENPVDNLIELFKTRLEKPLNAPGGLPANRDGTVIIADMGCGEAELAKQVSKLKGSSKSKRARFNIHSFDLHKANERITAADMASVPLENDSVHVVVFCLALMGTNITDFLEEGLRILKPKGEMWISEIKSRFEQNDRQTSLDRFVDKLKSMGLHHKHTDDSNKMFVRFEFVNLGRTDKRFIETEDSGPLLKPCIYKRR